MKFWINKESDVDNVLILAKNGLLISECKADHLEAVREKLNEKTHPLDIFSKDQVKKIRFADLVRIVSRNTDKDIEFFYKEGKEEKDFSYDFEDENAREQCINVLELILPEHLKKTVSQQAAIVAAMPPFFSLLLALATSWLYIDKFRWLTIIVGGIWVLGSLYMLYFRFSNPPEVTRWTLVGKYISRTWKTIKLWGSYAAAAAFVIVFSFRFPDTYGEDNIVNYFYHEGTLDKGMLEKLVNRGGDVNLKDRDGDAPLHLAIIYETPETIPDLISYGADTLMMNEGEVTPIMLAINYGNEEAVKYILDSEKPIGSLQGAMPDIISNAFSLETIDRLRPRGLAIMERDSEGRNALELALLWGADRGLIEGLLERGLSDEFQIDGLSIEEYLIENQREDLVDLFSISELQAR